MLGSQDGRSGNYYDGQMDDPAVWSRALAENEAKAIYNLGMAGKNLTNYENLITGISTLGLGFGTTDILRLADLYAAAAGSTILSGGSTWYYYANDPSWVPQNLTIGQTYTDAYGHHYIKLGSGNGDWDGVPEPATVAGVWVALIVIGYRRLRNRV